MASKYPTSRAAPVARPRPRPDNQGPRPGEVRPRPRPFPPPPDLRDLLRPGRNVQQAIGRNLNGLLRSGLSSGVQMLAQQLANSAEEEAANQAGAKFAASFLTRPSLAFWDESCRCPANCPVVDRISDLVYGAACGVGYEIYGFTGPAPATGLRSGGSLHGYKIVSRLQSPPYPAEAAGIPIWEPSVSWNLKPGAPVPVPALQPYAPPLSPGEFSQPVPGPQPSVWAAVGAAPALNVAVNPEPATSLDRDPAADPARTPRGRPSEGPVRWRVPTLPIPLVVVTGSSGWENVVQPRPDDQILDVGAPGQTGGGVTRVSSRRNSAADRRPRKRKKQKKATVRTAAGAGWAIVNGITEGVDFLKAMHKALPVEKRTKAVKWYGTGSDRKKTTRELTPQEMALDLARGWSSFQFAEALENYVNMQVSDMVAAMGSNATKKVAQDLGMVTGVDRAISRTQHRVQEGADVVDQEYETSEQARGGLAPRIDIDVESGQITLSAPAFGWSYALGW